MHFSNRLKNSISHIFELFIGKTVERKVCKSLVEYFFSVRAACCDSDYIIAELGVPSSSLFANLFTLGTAAKLTAPAELKEKFEKQLDEVAEFYKKRRDSGKIDFWLL